MSEKARLLIVDDEKIVRESLFHWFSEDGYEVVTAESGDAALKHFDQAPFDVFLLDIKMPGMDGLTLQQKLREVDPNVAVIIMTAYASVNTAVRALKEGAFDYIVKPFDPEDLAHVIRSALERRRLLRESAPPEIPVDARTEDGLARIVGQTPAIEHVKEMVRIVAPADTTVLISGESGTGKELVARAIHHASPRRHMPMVAMNCAGLPEGLMESELFGHEKGAFTGAEAKRRGKFELADGGTIFIDEVGDITPKTQIDLLRVLEERVFTRVGGTEPVKADFRVVVATNRNLRKMVDEKRFRLDLYYRINVFTIVLPPLRERVADIPLLVDHFLTKYAAAMGKPKGSLSEDALNALTRHEWPGNIRELENTIERALLVRKSLVIEPRDLPLVSEDTTMEHRLSLAEAERVHLQNILDMTGGNVSKAARALEIDRVTLYNKIKKYGLQR